MTGIYLEPGKSIFAQGSKTYYKIIKYLGQGGNAIAFRVQCTDGPYRGIAFVLKVQYNLSTETRRERFLRETLFLKEEVHPAILRHFDEGDYRLPDGRLFPFVVTNYFPQTLADIIKEAQSPAIPRTKRSRCRSSQEVNDSPTPFSALNYCLPALPIASMSLS